MFEQKSTIGLTLDNLSITRAQCRAGRALVEMDQNSLAAAASVSRGVIIDFESGKRTPGANNLAAIVAALEAAGVEFTNGGEPGVKLKKQLSETDILKRAKEICANEGMDWEPQVRETKR